MAAGALHGLRPIGTNALNLARIEAGFIITGMDFVPADTAVRADRARSPFELGLDWMIDWRQGPLQRPPRPPRREGQGLHLVPRRPRHRRQRPGRARHRLPRARRRRSATSPPPPGRPRPSATSRSPTSAAPTTHEERRPLGRDLRPARAPVRQAHAPRPRHPSPVLQPRAPPRHPARRLLRPAMNVALIAEPVPETWDRSGLPGWAYHSPAFLALEKAELFATHWQIVCHVCDLPEPGVVGRPRHRRRPGAGHPRPGRDDPRRPQPLPPPRRPRRRRRRRASAATPSSARSTAGSTTSTARCAARRGRAPSRATSTARSTA